MPLAAHAWACLSSNYYQCICAAVAACMMSMECTADCDSGVSPSFNDVVYALIIIIEEVKQCYKHFSHALAELSLEA